MTKDETVGWHHRFNAHEFEQTPGDSGGQGSLVCCSPRGRKELDTTQQLNNSSNLSEPSAFLRGYSPVREINNYHQSS